MKIQTKFLLNKRYTEKLFGSYLAGLWEGDGHITIPKINKEGKCANTAALHITFRDVNRPLVELLISHWGGWIREKKKERALVYSITKRKDLINIMLYMNGFLRSPKIFEFQILLSYLQPSLAEQPNSPLKGNVDTSPFDENSWLSGFIDADGGFKIRASLGESRRRVELRFALEERQLHRKTSLPFFPLLFSISNYLQVNLRKSKHNGREYWSIESTSPKKLEKLARYLNKYPLPPKKMISEIG